MFLLLVIVLLLVLDFAFDSCVLGWLVNLVAGAFSLAGCFTGCVW